MDTPHQPLATPPATPTPPVSPAPKSTAQAKLQKAKSLFSTLSIFILAPIIALLLTAFVFQSYEVDGSSMESTLQHQDRLIILKLPKTWSRIRGKDFVPKRYEVIVFSRQEAPGSSKQLIKRVIGIPGDRVVVKNGKVTIYNNEHPDGYNPDKGQPYEANLIGSTPGNADITLDPGELFVIGDNRSNSLDSPDFGPIHSNDIAGELVLRIYPFNKMSGY